MTLQYWVENFLHDISYWTVEYFWRNWNVNIIRIETSFSFFQIQLLERLKTLDKFLNPEFDISSLKFELTGSEISFEIINLCTNWIIISIQRVNSFCLELALGWVQYSVLLWNCWGIPLARKTKYRCEITAKKTLVVSTFLWNFPSILNNINFVQITPL